MQTLQPPPNPARARQRIAEPSRVRAILHPLIARNLLIQHLIHLHYPSPLCRVQGQRFLPYCLVSDGGGGAGDAAQDAERAAALGDEFGDCACGAGGGAVDGVADVGDCAVDRGAEISSVVVGGRGGG